MALLIDGIPTLQRTRLRTLYYNYKMKELEDISVWRAIGSVEQDNVLDEAAKRLAPDFVLEQKESYVSVRTATFRHTATQLDFVLVVGGEFRMGFSESEEISALAIGATLPVLPEELRPVHSVRVQPFLITKFPIQKAFAQSLVDLDADVFRPEFSGESDSVPIYLTRKEAETICRETGFDLPSEAQWEYACRGGTASLFYFGDRLPDNRTLSDEILLARFDDLEVNKRAANPFGLVGLCVGEWCRDGYRPYGSNRVTGDDAAPGGSPYVVRGGAASLWPWQDGSEWFLCVSAMRWSSEILEGNTCSMRLMCRLGF